LAASNSPRRYAIPLFPQLSGHHQRADVERVAQEFRDKGYDVVVEPSASELPDFVREYRPDIIARSNQGSVVVEVKHAVSVADRERIRAIAQKVESRPDWRFVLISPAAEGPLLAGEAVWLLSANRIHDLLRDVDALRQTGHNEGALLVSWAALEAAMRLAAQQHSLESRQPDTWTLMRELVSNGVLDRESYQQLIGIFKLRSAVAHGLEPLQRADVNQAIGVLVRLAADLLSESAATDSPSP
jgi:hypothetical protein